jgi:tRNA modification GTPase
MDLTEVEGLADLIAADTAAQRKQALRQMGGGLRVTYEGWREELKVCLAHTEAVIDFGDDELDVDEAAYDAIRPRAATLREEMRRHLADGNRGEVIRSGIRVAIVGPPNAGKSTLLNLLARRPAAIVSPIAGTTRDVVEVQLELAGLPVLVSDTAGIREAAADEVEQEGIRRAREAAEQAQLTLVVLDASGTLGSEALASLAGVGPFAPDAPPRALSEVLAAVEKDAGLLLVVNKRDAVTEGSDLATRLLAGGGEGGEKGGKAAFFVSCSTGEGVEEMLGGLQARLEGVFDRGGTEQERNEAPVITRARHRVHVEKCVEALTSFLEDRNLGLDVAAEELRIASTELGRITGAVDVEEVLDVIFRDFCIGK